MSARFFSSSPLADLRATLVDAEAHHLLHVLRARVGDEVVLFDGGGGECVARVAQLKRSSVELEILERRDVSREASRRIVVGAPLPKGDRQRWLVEKLVELGVARFTPLLTTRGVAKPESSALERLEKVVIEASKQCGRNRLLQIDAPATLAEFVTTAPTDAVRLLAHPGESPPTELVAGANQDVFAAVGPEGGWTDAEVDAARGAGWNCVSLGAAILRVETAAVAIAARFSLPF